MECKATKETFNRSPHIIKVEPYWNVKFGTKIKIQGTGTIKVEPYWNVKLYLYTLMQYTGIKLK